MLGVGIEQILKSKKAEILRIAAEHGARSVRVFGSFARGDARPESDVDLLVEFEDGRTLSDLGLFSEDLQTLLGRRVDVAEPGGLHWYVKDRILREAIPL